MRLGNVGKIFATVDAGFEVEAFLLGLNENVTGACSCHNSVLL
jgi:hypothetical protein